MAKLFGIAGAATSGKDTFFKLMVDCFPEKQFRRFALADRLKEEIDPVLQQHFGVSAFTTDPVQKERIRPMLVAWGRIRRNDSSGTHWTGIVEPIARKELQDGVNVVVTDIRYNEFKDDELSWLRKMDGLLVFVLRFDSAGNPIPGANADEIENNKTLMALADYVVKWPTTPEVSNLKSYLRFLEGIF